MTGKEVYEALTQGQHVNIEDSTGHWLHATAWSDPTNNRVGINGFDWCGEPYVRGLYPEDQVNATIADCNGCSEKPLGK